MVEKKEFIAVAEADSLLDDQALACMVDNQPVLVFRLGHEIYAVSGICTHAYSELAEGEWDGVRLYCSLHFACFDIRSGAVLEGPAEEPLKTFEVKEYQGKIWIKGNGKTNG